MTEVRFPRAVYTWMDGWEVEIHLRCHFCFRFIIKRVKMEQIYIRKYVGCAGCYNGVEVTIDPELTF
jgi:protein-arginine kinase activator protein McsA